MQAQKGKSIKADSETVWRLDPSHTIMEFNVSTLVFFTVKGRLIALDGRIVLDESDLHRSSVEATIKADSIDTGNRRRDQHLRSPAILDTNSYPSMQFWSSKVGPGKDRDMFAVTGSLTIKNKSKEIVLDVTEVDRSRSPRGEEVIYYVATTELDRFDFDVKYAPGLVGRRLKVAINVQASRPIQT